MMSQREKWVETETHILRNNPAQADEPETGYKTREGYFNDIDPDSY